MGEWEGAKDKGHLAEDKGIRTKVLSRNFRVGPAFEPGSGLSLSKCFGPISGLHMQVSTIRSNDFFLS